MERYLPAMVATLLALSLLACGSAAEPTPTEVAQAPPAEEVAPSEEAVEPTDEPTEPPPPTATEEPPPTGTEVPPTPTEVPPTATEVPPSPPEVPPFEINSTAFDPGAAIPVVYSCFGDNASPPLEWTGVPEGAQTLALLLDDPDSVPAGFVHWVIFDIPPDATGLAEDVPGDGELADGSRQGSNDFAPFGPGTFPGGAEYKTVGYDGPCPGGEHRYVFTLYALDAPLGLAAEVTMAEVVAAMEGHVLAEAELIGLFAPP